jgi:hypothetical protein
MGKNPSRKRYDGIETLLRDAAQVEKFVTLSAMLMRWRSLRGSTQQQRLATSKPSSAGLAALIQENFSDERF